jgi:hypothetical protein
VVRAEIERDASQRRTDQVAQKVGAAPKVASVAGGGNEVLRRTQTEEEECGTVRQKSVFLSCPGFDPLFLTAATAALHCACDAEVIPNRVIRQAGLGREKGKALVLGRGPVLPEPPDGDKSCARIVLNDQARLRGVGDVKSLQGCLEVGFEAHI